MKVQWQISATRQNPLRAAHRKARDSISFLHDKRAAFMEIQSFQRHIADVNPKHENKQKILSFEDKA